MSYIHTESDTEHKDEDLMVSERVSISRSNRATNEIDERDRGLIIARVIHHVGGGIRWSYNRNLAIAFAIAVALHAAIVGLYVLSTIGDEPVVRRAIPTLGSLIPDTSFIPIDMREVTVIKEGGGGGDVTSKEGVGKAKAGDPYAAPKYVAEKPKSDKTAKVFDPKAPTKIKPVDKPNVDDRPVATTDRDTSRVASSGAGEKGQHADGKGTTNAGGSGGLGVGNGVGIGVGDGSGMGGRGWIRRPKGGRSANLAASGRVVLQFTVMPDGEITNIRPIKKAHASLVDDAIRRLSAAKARPLPEDQPQKPVTVSIPFNYDIR